MKKIFIIAIGLLSGFLITFTCTKEYSREGLYNQVDSSDIIIDTSLNELITSCSIYIADNKEVKFIYPQVKTKKWPGHHWIFTEIAMDTTISSLYERTYNLKDFLNMSDYKKGDSFFVRYEVRNRFVPPEFLQHDTLIY